MKLLCEQSYQLLCMFLIKIIMVIISSSCVNTLHYAISSLIYLVLKKKIKKIIIWFGLSLLKYKNSFISSCNYKLIIFLSSS